jgi:hypothetical protein
MRNKLPKLTILVFAAIAVAFTVITLIDPRFKRSPISEEDEEGGIPKQDRMDLAWEQEFEMTKDPRLGYVPKRRILAAWDYTKAQLSLAARGNDVIPGIQWVALGSKNNGGRTRSLLVDLNDATRNTIWAGSVGGGLWKTTDITATAPNWTPVNDLMGNLAITSITQDPSNTQNIYFGTGEGYGNSDAVRGLGIWKSSNGGTTWAQLSSTDNANFYYNNKVFTTTTGVLFSCTNTGLYRSTDGGAGFIKVLGSGISGATSNTCYDIEQAANGDLYASVSGSVHKSGDGGITWGTALPIGLTATRIEIATAPSSSTTLYVLAANGSTVNGIAQSTNRGLSFTTKTKPADADGGISASDFSRGQAWYDLTIAVSPTDANSVFVGGVDLFKSPDGCSTWQQIAHWYGGFGFQNVHADQHNIIFSPGSGDIVYFTNDGAIYRSTSATEAIPTITSKETNYNTLQFYACGMNPTAGSFEFITGAQDNGSHKFTQPVFGNTTDVTGGDGAFCHIDQNEPQYWFTSYVYNNYYRSSNGGTSFSSASHGNNGRFINPTDYDDNANLMYCARSSNQYLRWENPQSGNTFTIVSCPELDGTVSAVKASPNTANRVFFGTGNGNIVRVDNANTATPAATLINFFSGMSGYISCIDVEPGNDNHILVTFSNYGVNSIWETTNGGTNWLSVEGNLPDMPVRWIIFNPNNNNQALIATELGVWSTNALDGSSTVWGASNNGLANVRVDMLQSRASDKLVIAATHGRGLYYTSAFSPATANFSTETKVIYPGRALQFSNGSFNAISYAWDFGDGTNSNQPSPLKKFNQPGVYNVSLSINGGASVIAKTITVMPFSGTPYSPANGGNFETNTNHFVVETISGTAWERGTSFITGKNGVNSGVNAWVTGLNLTTYANNSESYLYGPTYNLSAAGSYDLSFYTKYVFETDFDGFRVEYSLDTGKTWIPLGTTTGANWYNFANTGGTTAFATGQAFFSGTVSSFTKKNYNISFLAGNNQVAIRFAFKTDGGVTAAGAAIDDVEITGSANNPLLLNLLSFIASKDNKDVLLDWLTANEVGVSHFEIQRSWNGSEFLTIATRQAQNRINNSYGLKDALSKLTNKPSNNTFYRLKIVDKDGKFNYSHVVQLKWSDLQNALVSVYPNPFINYLQISTRLKVNSAQLLDNKGRLVAQISVLNNGRFNLPALPIGTYFLRLNTSEGVITQKLLKH